MSTQPSDNGFVEVSLEDKRRIVSLCQSLNTLTTKGWWLMPKQCFLVVPLSTYRRGKRSGPQNVLKVDPQRANIEIPKPLLHSSFLKYTRPQGNSFLDGQVKEMLKGTTLPSTNVGNLSTPSCGALLLLLTN